MSTDYNNSLENFAVLIANDVKSLIARDTSIATNLGDITTLSTTNKETVVKAINEIRTQIQNASSINDSGASTSTTESLSINGTVQLINTQINELIGGAPTTADTLKELNDLITSNDGDIATLIASLGNCIKFNTAQSLTDAQKNLALANLGLDSSNLITVYNNAKNA